MPRMLRSRLVRAGLSVLLATTSCARLHSADPADDDTDVVTVNVVNHNFLNISVYNIVQGHRERIGEVTSTSRLTVRLHLRRIIGGEIQLYADPVGSSRSVTSEVLHVSAGDTVQWTIETDLDRSHIEVR